jgi:predicted LPLAT superfamily acyltransferase
MKPCLLIPIYDHPATIAAVVEALAPLDLPCLIVDDGSGEETRRVLDRLAPRFEWVRVERHERNAGRGAALQTGYRSAARLGYSHAVQLDADGQHDAADVPAMLDAARRHPDALVLGEPIFDESAPLARRFGRSISRFWVWLETCSLAIRDPLCGFRCMPLLPTVRILDDVRCGTHMDFDLEIVVRLAWAGSPVVGVPTRVRYFADGVSHFDMFRDNVRLTWLHTRLFLGMLLRLPRLLAPRLRREPAVDQGPPAEQGKHWYEKRERGSTLGMRITIWCYRRLGRPIARLLLYPIVAYFFLTDRAGRRASRRYLERLHADPAGARTLAGPPGRRHVFRHFLEFGRSILDRAGFWLGEPADFHLVIQGLEELERVPEEKRGALVLGAHIGSFDAMRLLAESHSPIAVNVLMFTRHAARINAFLDGLSERSSRGSLPVRVIDVVPNSFQHVTEARRCVERGEVVAILADRVPPGEASRVSKVQLLGGTALLPHGPFKLAALLGCPVLLMIGLRERDKAYAIHVERFADHVELPREGRGAALDALCQAYADRLASYCVRAPYQWFNFYDFWGQVDSNV